MKKFCICLAVLVLVISCAKQKDVYELQSLTEYDLNSMGRVLNRGWDSVEISSLEIPLELRGKIKVHFLTPFGQQSYLLNKDQVEVRAEFRGLGAHNQSSDLDYKISYFKFLLRGDEYSYGFDDVITKKLNTAIHSSGVAQKINNNQFITCYLGKESGELTEEDEDLFNRVKRDPQLAKTFVNNDSNRYLFVSWVEIID